MTILIVLLSMALVLDCLLLSLLVLLQLPKKDAGVGMAFGGGAADALFGSGSGTALTQLTKYATGAFFGLVIVLSLATSHAKHSDGSGFKRAVEQANLPATPTLRAAPTTNTTPAPAVTPAATNAGFQLLSTSNAPAAPVKVPAESNAPTAAPK